MSKLIETRAEFQQMAEQRLEEAKVLLDAEMWPGAYYLSGYAVELSLKACIIKMLMATDAFPKKKFSENCYIHAIDPLVALAKLEDARKAAVDIDADLEKNWSLAKNWSEEKRYHQISEIEAVDLYTAIADDVHGVFSWIKTQW